MTDQYTREDAVAAIIAMDAPQEEVVVAPEGTNESTTTQVDDIGEEAIPGDDVLEEIPVEELTAEAEAEPVDAPNWWDAEAKGRFAELAPELQAIVRAQEDKREVVTQKAKQEAAEARKTAEAEVNNLQKLAERANEVFGRAEATFKSKWDGMTPEIWSQLAQEDPETAFQLKLEYDAEQDNLKNVRETQAETTRIAQAKHFEEQRTKLAELAPELVKSPERLQQVGKYIVDAGIPAEAISNADAIELNMVYKAMKYDEMIARARAAKNAAPTSTKAVPQKSLAPANTRETQLPPQERNIQQIKNRLNQTGSRDDLASLFKAGAFG